VRICFPKIYKSEEVADEIIKKVRSSLDDLYDEYVALSLVEASSSDGNFNSNNQSSSQANVAAVKTGFDEIMCIIQENEAIGPMKSELQEYLDEGVYIPPIPTSFSALDWWRNNSMKYKILSKMAADILAIPISILNCGIRVHMSTIFNMQFSTSFDIHTCKRGFFFLISQERGGFSILIRIC
jgi:hypothetical protein